MPVATGAGATPTPRIQGERFTKLTTAMVIAIPLTSTGSRLYTCDFVMRFRH